MQDLSIEKIDAVRAAIEQAATVQEIKHALNVASAAQVYAQQSKAGKEVELRVSEYVLQRRAQTRRDSTRGESSRADKGGESIVFRNCTR
jgi:hypothetical protein